MRLGRFFFWQREPRGATFSLSMIIWLLVLFVLQLWVAETQGADDSVNIERSARVLAALFLFAGIAAGYLALFGKGIIRQRVFSIQKQARPAFLLLSLWTLIVVVATLQGLQAHNETTFLAGDSYRFCLLPLLFGLTYFGIRTRQQLDRVLEGLVIVFGIALLVDFFRSFTWVVTHGGRFVTSSTYHIATLSPVILYLVMSRKGSRLFRRLLWFVVFEVCAAIVLMQGLSDYLYAALVLLTFLFFYRNRKLVFVLVLLGALAFVGIADPFSLFGGEGTYASNKLQFAFDVSSGFGLELAEWVTGSRLGEVVGIIDEYAASPGRLPLGFGMGGISEAAPVRLGETPKTDFTPPWEVDRHFIHSGLFEVFYRTGLAGTTLLLLFLLYCYWRGRRLASGPHRSFGVFVMANSVYQAFNVAIESPITYVWLVLAISLVGTFVLECAPSEEAARAALPLRRDAGHPTTSH